MKLAFTPILIAGLQLALLANVGNAYFSYSSDSDVAARDLGYDLSDASFARSVYVPEISEISTRALVEELENRLIRRGDKVADLEAKLAAPGLSKKKKKKLEQELRKAKKKADKKAATAGAADPANAQPAEGEHGSRHQAEPEAV